MRKSVSTEVNYGIRFTEEAELNTFLRQLCTEVHNRLVEYRAKGKTITLKYMVRAKDAPLETAKFMGHGFCDNITKSTTLKTYTCDLDLIMQTIFTIKDNLNVPPNELRGIGIHISKLDLGDSNKPNVLKNMFEKASEKLKSKQCDPIDVKPPMILEPTRVKEEVDKSKTYVKGKRTIRKSKSFSSGSADIAQMFNNASNRNQEMYQDIDLDVLAELPEDIREQVLRDHIMVVKRKGSTTAGPSAGIKTETKIEKNDMSINSAASSHGANDSRNTSTDLGSSEHTTSNLNSTDVIELFSQT